MSFGLTDFALGVFEQMCPLEIFIDFPWITSKASPISVLDLRETRRAPARHGWPTLSLRHATLLHVAFSYEKVSCPLLFHLTVVCLPGQMESEVKVQHQLWPSSPEFSFKPKCCRPLGCCYSQGFTGLVLTVCWSRVTPGTASAQRPGALGLGPWVASCLLSTEKMVFEACLQKPVRRGQLTPCRHGRPGL